MRLYDPIDETPRRRLDLDATGRVLLIFFPSYEDDFQTLLTRVKSLPGRRFEKTPSPHWQVPFSAPVLRQACRLFERFAVSLAIKAKVEELREREKAKGDLIGAPQPDWINITLFPFQRAGVAALRKLSAALLGDEMGLGKTLQGIAWASAPDATKPVTTAWCSACGRGLYTKDAAAEGIGPLCAAMIKESLGKETPARTEAQPFGTIVVCPASVKLNWRREILRARPKDRVVIVDAKTAVPKAGDAAWVIINYDILTRKVRELQAFNALSIILDECHMVKNREAKRTKTALDLAAEIPRRLPMSGTPIVNRPRELFTLLRLLGEKREKDFWSYAQRYCGASQSWAGSARGMVWDFSGASNLEELHGVIQPFFVRRLKKDVLPELPPILYTDMDVALEPRAAAEYADAEEDFKSWYESKGREASDQIHLQKLTALRQLCVAGKVPAMLEVLSQYREERTKALVFSSFVQAGINQLEAGLTPGEYVRLTGDESPTKRQEAIDRFQNDPNILFALCSTAAAGVGLNLTAAATVFFLDLPWTPGEKQQAEARVHRIGQTAESIQVAHLLAYGTVDEVMLNVITEKAEVIGAVLDGGKPDAERLAAAARVTAGTIAREVGGRLVGRKAA